MCPQGTRKYIHIRASPDSSFKTTSDCNAPVGWNGLILFKDPLDGVELVDGGVGGVVVDVQVVLGAVVVGVGHHQVGLLAHGEELPVCRAVRLHACQRESSNEHFKGYICE